MSDPSSPLSDMSVKHTDSVSKMLFHTKKKMSNGKGQKVTTICETPHSKITDSLILYMDKKFKLSESA